MAALSYSIAPLAVRPWTLNGIWARLIESHYEPSYGTAVVRLNAVTEELSGLDPKASPVSLVRRLKQEQAALLNATLLHELCFQSLGGDGRALPPFISTALASDFGSLEAWRREFTVLAEALGGHVEARAGKRERRGERGGGEDLSTHLAILLGFQATLRPSLAIAGEDLEASVALLFAGSDRRSLQVIGCPARQIMLEVTLEQTRNASCRIRGQMTDRLISGQKREEDAEPSLRPQLLAEFIGQEQARRNLRVFIEAAKARGDALDHVLFAGPPGLGKTTLAQIMARELGVGFRMTSGPVISKAGDLAALLTNLEERDVLFIDEIHRLNPAIEEVLYPAMEDFQLDLIIGEGPAARSVRIDLAKFTLVGATTRAGLLTTPLRDRFGIPVRLNFYTVEELELIVARGADVLKCQMSKDGAHEIARRSRGTPRVAGRLLRRVRDFAAVDGVRVINAEAADKALIELEVDKEGLDALDHRYLKCIALNYEGGPVGIETIAAALSEPRDALEEIVEPYLLQQGFIGRTPRGRIVTLKAYRHLGLATPRRAPEQATLFESGET